MCKQNAQHARQTKFSDRMTIDLAVNLQNCMLKFAKEKARDNAKLGKITNNVTNRRRWSTT